MRNLHLAGTAAIAAAAILTTAYATGSAVIAQTSPGQTGAAKLAAQWHINKELSADVHDALGGPPAPGGPTPIGGGYPGGGNGMGRGGGYGGGGFGGYTGGGGPTSERTLRDRAILREAGQMPDVLNIVVSGTVVTMTTEDGTVRKFNATGKKEKVDLTTAEVDTITQWDKNTLVQEMSNGDLKLKRTWSPSEQGNQLVITVTTERTKRVDPVTVKLIYDKGTE